MTTLRWAPIAIAALTAAGSARAQCTSHVQQLVNDRKFSEARTEAQALLARLPDDDALLHCLGIISIDSDRPREAADFFERAIKLNDKSSAHHLWLGNSLGSLADSTSKFKLPFLARRIKAEFERASQLDPRSIEARNGLIQFYSQAPGVMGGSMDKAKEQAREIGKISPIRGRVAMGNILLGDKKVAEAEAEFVGGTKDSPDSASAWFALGSFYQSQERWAEAFSTYDRMLKQFPSEALVHFQIGRTAAISGQQLDRGETELKSWIASPPKDAATGTIAGAHHRLGMIYEKQGKKDLARAEYLKALAIDPSNKNAKKSLDALK